MRPVFIIVEGGKTKGMGHIVRQFALAQLLNTEKKAVVYLETDWTKEEIKKKELFFKNIIPIKKMSEAFGQVPSGALLFMDGYDFDIKEINKLRKLKNWKIIFVADIHKKVPDCEVLINHLPWIKKDQYPKAKISRKLFGPKYAILRKPFYSGKTTADKKRIFICLGGSNVEEQIINIYKALIRSGTQSSLIDVLYHQPIAGIPASSLHYNLSAKQVHSLISSAKLCFITPGNISYEVFSVNRSAIMGSVAKDQKPIVEKFQKLGLSYNVGEWSKAKYKNMKLWIDKAAGTKKEQQRFFRDLNSQNIKKQVISYIN